VNNDRHRLELMQTEISATVASMKDDEGKKIDVKQIMQNIKDIIADVDSIAKRVEVLEKKTAGIKPVKEIKAAKETP
jgi:hypothetical protein